MQNLLANLNQPQLEAVHYLEGPLLIIAGAGSGKTRVITHKIAYLIKNCGYLAKHITAITFTNKTAKEMLERSTKLLTGVNSRGLRITTFHSLGLKILKEEAQHLGYKANFSLFDGYDSAKVISDLIKTTDKAIIYAIQQQISLWKNSFFTPEYALSTAKDEIEVNQAKAFQLYQDALKTYQAVDFDDLIKLPVELLSNNLEVLYKWQQKIRYLLIDEYQDTNSCQYNLIKLLTARSGKLTAVGDDDQSIYAWRGANLSNLQNLAIDFKQLKVIKLEQNYRSTTTILNAANNLIKNNPKLFEKKLWSNFGQGEAIRIIACNNEEAEADMVVRKIMLHQMQLQTKFSDYAILYRSNHQARVVEQTLKNYQLPYTISGGQSFFEKAEIKDIMAYLRLIINDEDDSAFIRAITTPKRGIGQVTLDKLANYAKGRNISLFAALFEEGFSASCTLVQLVELHNFGNFINNCQFKLTKHNLSELLTELITTINYEEYLYQQETAKTAEKKWGNVLSLIGWLTKKAEDNNKTLADLVQAITLISMLEGKADKEVQTIKLSTLHAAKGLEYPYVFLISCEDGILPHQESINSEMIEEERRLFYVGITRAQKELTISYCEKRRQGGEIRTSERSRFLQEMGEENIIDEANRRLEKISNNAELKNRLEGLKNLLK